MVKRWEYLVVDMLSNMKCGDVEQLFNSYGEQGWELVAVTLNGSATDSSKLWDNRAYFKRSV